MIGKLLWVPTAALALCVATPAYADPPESCQWTAGTSHQLDRSSPDAAAILAASTADVNRQLGKPASLDPKGLNTASDWAFLNARILGANGDWIDYTGTPFAEGSHSKNYYALARRGSDTTWTLVDTQVGPSDAADEGWPGRYGSPPVFWRCG